MPSKEVLTQVANRCNILICTILHHPTHTKVNTYPTCMPPLDCTVYQLTCATQGHEQTGIIFAYAHSVYWKMVAYKNVTPEVRIVQIV